MSNAPLFIDQRRRLQRRRCYDQDVLGRWCDLNPMCADRVVERLSGRGTTREEDARGTPTQSHMSPSILVYGEYQKLADSIHRRLQITSQLLFKSVQTLLS